MAVAALALVIGHFMFNYVDYAQLGRIASFRRRRILTARMTASLLAVGLAIAIARRFEQGSASRVVGSSSQLQW